MGSLAPWFQYFTLPKGSVRMNRSGRTAPNELDWQYALQWTKHRGRLPQQISSGLILMILLKEKSTWMRHRETLAKGRSYLCPILVKRKNKELFCLAEKYCSALMWYDTSDQGSLHPGDQASRWDWKQFIANKSWHEVMVVQNRYNRRLHGNKG